MWNSSKYCNLGLDIATDIFELNIYVHDYFENTKFCGKIGNSSNRNKLVEKKYFVFFSIEKTMLRISI